MLLGRKLLWGKARLGHWRFAFRELIDLKLVIDLKNQVIVFSLDMCLKRRVLLAFFNVIVICSHTFGLFDVFITLLSIVLQGKVLKKVNQTSTMTMTFQNFNMFCPLNTNSEVKPGLSGTNPEKEKNKKMQKLE